MNYKRILALLLAAALCIVCMTGCNQATSARNAIELFEQEMNELDYKGAFAYVADYDGFGFSNSDGVREIIDAVARSMDIQIINDVSGLSSANIDVRITTIDLRELYRQAVENVLPGFYGQAIAGPTIPESEILDAIVEQIIVLAGSPDVATVSTDLTLNLYLDNKDRWLIALDQQSYAAITGYLDEANALVTAGNLIVATTAPTTTTTTAAQPEDESAQTEETE